MAVDLETRKRELENEKVEIMKTSAQFGLFLKQNSLMEYNDGMVGYLNLMIKQAKEQGDLTQVTFPLHFSFGNEKQCRYYFSTAGLHAGGKSRKAQGAL